jgi:hypothetical protein
MKPIDISDEDRMEAMRKRLLQRVRRLNFFLPLMLISAGLAGGFGAILLSPLLVLAWAGAFATGVVAGLASIVASFKLADSCFNRWSDKANMIGKAQSARAAQRQAEHAPRHALPPRGDAGKAFMDSLTAGLQEKLQVKKPLTLRKPQQARD